MAYHRCCAACRRRLGGRRDPGLVRPCGRHRRHPGQLPPDQRHIAYDRGRGLGWRNRRLSNPDFAAAHPRQAGRASYCRAQPRSIFLGRYGLRPRHCRDRAHQQPAHHRRREYRPVTRLALWTIAPCQAGAVRTDAGTRRRQSPATHAGARRCGGGW